MSRDRTPGDTMPDTISPEDALTLALTSKSFAKHVLAVARTKGLDPDQAGGSTPSGGKAPRMHPEAQRRHNAKLIRQNKIKASELGKNKGPFASAKHIGRPGNGAPQRTSLKPLWDGDQLRQRLQSYDRTPFLDLLAIWMECAPTPQTIMAFADKYPDRWTKALVDLSRVGGFAEKKEIDFNFAAQVARMSDSQLEDGLREQAYRLGIPLPALLTMMSTQIQTPQGAQPPAEGGLVRAMQRSKDAIDVVATSEVAEQPVAKQQSVEPRSAVGAATLPDESQ